MITYKQIGEWFYYPHTGKWYRFFDTIEVGTENLVVRVCQEYAPKRRLNNGTTE